jgi:hypothetical protein
MSALSALRRLLTWPVAFALATSALCAQELPKKGAGLDADLEPKLMLNDLPSGPLPAPAGLAAAAPVSLDVAKLESDLAKAKKTAAWYQRLFKEGVLAKIEAENAALKIIRITRDLETARVQVLTRDVEEKRQRAEKGEVSKESLAEAETALATATATATAANTTWSESQRAAAELRVQRERRLLAVGAGSRYSVKKAEAALQGLNTP